MSDSPAEEPDYEACAGCGELLDLTTFGPFETAICPHCSVETHVKRDFGQYRLERKYAVGGMSVIFVGWDLTLNREVAIKVLNEEYCHDEVRIQAFENEARLTAQVSHPNVVKVYAVGRAYGRFYLVMELLEGRSFESIISKRGALPEDEVINVALQVAAGLQAAKSAGMIHRDVKPGNILIDEDGLAKLLDFGLALITQDGNAQAQEIWATPYYVPPEALERGIEDFRSDIYAFGATLYHALAGRPPFESTSSANNVLRRAKQTVPRLTKVAPWIGADTGEAIDRMMAFNPDHRWASYEDVIQALEVARRNVGSVAPTPIHGKGRLKRRKKGRLKGAIAALCLLGITAGLAVWQPWKKTKPIASEPAVDLPEEEAEVIFNPGLTENANPLWQKARDLVKQDKFQEATTLFRKLSRHKQLSTRSQAWAALEGSVTANFDGQPGPAKQLARYATRLLESLKEPAESDTKLAHFSRTLTRPEPPEAHDFPGEPSDLTSAMGTLALSLKQWSQGQIAASLPNFAQVRDSQLEPEFEWFRIYQNLCDRYLADGQILRPFDAPGNPANEAEASALIQNCREAQKTLQTKGRAKLNLRARIIHATRLRKGFREAPPETQNMQWSALVTRITKLGKTGRFDQILEILDDAPADASTDALWAWQYLTTRAKGFLKDLGENQEGDATALLIRHSKIRPADDRKMRIRAIAFAWLSGLTTEAEEEAEELAASDPDFLQDWKRVLVGTSQ